MRLSLFYHDSCENKTGKLKCVLGAKATETQKARGAFTTVEALRALLSFYVKD